MSVCLSVYLSVCLYAVDAKKTPYRDRKGRENRGPQGRDNSVQRTAEARKAETIEFAAAWRMVIKILTGPKGPRE